MQYEYTLFEHMIVELSYPEGPENIDFCPFCCQAMDETDRVICAIQDASSEEANEPVFRKFITQHANRISDLRESLISVKRPYKEFLGKCFQDIEAFINNNFREALLPSQAVKPRRFHYAI